MRALRRHVRLVPAADSCSAALASVFRSWPAELFAGEWVQRPSWIAWGFFRPKVSPGLSAIRMAIGGGSEMPDFSAFDDLDARLEMIPRQSFSASALIRAINHRPAGPGGASARNAADKVSHTPLFGISTTSRMTSAPES